MASTYTVANAITYTQAMCVGIPVSTVQVVAADVIHSIIWNVYPWRWACKNYASNIALIDGTQDYAWAPTDYMRLTHARLIRTDTTPDIYDELTVLRNLTPDLTKAGFRSGLSSISYGRVAPASVRLNQAAAVPTGVTIEIQLEYQFQPTKITATSATFPFPDQYFNVFCDGMLWQFYLLAKDSRAGTSQATKAGGAVYTGQMGIFYDSLMTMRDAEDWGAGDTIFPSDPLGASGSGNAFAGIYSP